MGFVYILKLVDGSYYIGSCREIISRLENHKNGYVKSTKYKLTFILVYVKEFVSYKEAYNEERRIKGWKKRKSIENLYTLDTNNKVNSYAPIV